MRVSLRKDEPGCSTDYQVFLVYVQRTKLTIPQMKAVASVECGQTITGRAEQVRTQLFELLPACPDPDTEDDSDNDDLPELVEVDTDSESDGAPEFASQYDDANIVIMVPIENMRVGDCVEVER